MTLSEYCFQFEGLGAIVVEAPKVSGSGIARELETKRSSAGFFGGDFSMIQIMPRVSTASRINSITTLTISISILSYKKTGSGIGESNPLLLLGKELFYR